MKVILKVDKYKYIYIYIKYVIVLFVTYIYIYIQNNHIFCAEPQNNTIDQCYFTGAIVLVYHFFFTISIYVIENTLYHICMIRD